MNNSENLKSANVKVVSTPAEIDANLEGENMILFFRDGCPYAGNFIESGVLSDIDSVSGESLRVFAVNTSISKDDVLNWAGEKSIKDSDYTWRDVLEKRAPPEGERQIYTVPTIVYSGARGVSRFPGAEPEDRTMEDVATWLAERTGDDGWRPVEVPLLTEAMQNAAKPEFVIFYDERVPFIPKFSGGPKSMYSAAARMWEAFEKRRDDILSRGSAVSGDAFVEEPVAMNLRGLWTADSLCKVTSRSPPDAFDDLDRVSADFERFFESFF